MNSFLTLAAAIVSLAVVYFQAPPADVDYFPVGVFGLPTLTEQGDRQVDQEMRASISSELRIMDEPSLWEVSQKQRREAYRFVWLRSFHQPVAIRLMINADGSGDLVAKILSGEGGHDAGALVTNQHSLLLPVETRSFTEKLSKANFWALSTRRFQDIYGRDGADWILEGTKEGNYHVVHRWSPPNGPYREACLYLALGLAELKIPDREIY